MSEKYVNYALIDSQNYDDDDDDDDDYDSGYTYYLLAIINSKASQIVA
jgi:hypothetical protein